MRAQRKHRSFEDILLLSNRSLSMREPVGLSNWVKAVGIPHMPAPVSGLVGIGSLRDTPSILRHCDILKCLVGL